MLALLKWCSFENYLYVLFNGVTQLKWHTQLISISVHGDGDEMGMPFDKFIIFLWDNFQMASDRTFSQ